MTQDPTLQEIQNEWHGTLKSYLIGFTICIVLTGLSFFLVLTKFFPDPYLIYLVVGLALIQAIAQLIFFLHVGQEAKPCWETLIFCFMVTVLLIIAGGSLWIMHDLNDRVMSDMKGMSYD